MINSQSYASSVDDAVLEPHIILALINTLTYLVAITIGTCQTVVEKYVI